MKFSVYMWLLSLPELMSTMLQELNDGRIYIGV